MLSLTNASLFLSVTGLLAQPAALPRIRMYVSNLSILNVVTIMGAIIRKINLGTFFSTDPTVYTRACS